MNQTCIDTYFADGGKLVLAADFKGPLVDKLYVEGAIELQTGGVILISKKWIDLVDQLWSYLADLVCHVLAGRAAEVFFPDQPIKLRCSPLQRGLFQFESSVNETVTQATLAFEEFLPKFCRAGLSFHDELLRLDPTAKVQCNINLFRSLSCGKVPDHYAFIYEREGTVSTLSDRGYMGTFCL